jgi:hypothetical protein
MHRNTIIDVESIDDEILYGGDVGDDLDQMLTNPIA